jgi:hypothetical protein
MTTQVCGEQRRREVTTKQMEITERTPVLEKYKNRGQNKRAFTI